MSELEKLQDQTFLARNRIQELQEQLSATQQKLHELQDRLTLSDQERAVLEGESDGCIRVGDLRPIVDRILGRAA
jgi:hypothetical protein